MVPCLMVVLSGLRFETLQDSCSRNGTNQQVLRELFFIITIVIVLRWVQPGSS